ncbi:MAG: hypothetical protein HFJ98_05645 [Eubacterium sp.]|nr:hypothetical protein [Eubacterium sp.]
MSKNRLAQIQSIVLDLLQSDNRCKKDDIYLYSRAIEVITKNNGTYCGEIKQLVTLLQRYGKDLPKFSTVMRSRQSLQSDNPELKDNYTAEMRKEQEYQFRGFFRRD